MNKADVPSPVDVIRANDPSGYGITPARVKEVQELQMGPIAKNERTGSSEKSFSRK